MGKELHSSRPDIGFHQSVINVWSAITEARYRREQSLLELQPVAIATQVYPHAELAAQEIAVQNLTEFLPFVQRASESAGCSSSIDHTQFVQRDVFSVVQPRPFDRYEILIHRGEEHTQKSFTAALQTILGHFDAHSLFFPLGTPKGGHPDVFAWLYSQSRYSLKEALNARLSHA